MIASGLVRKPKRPTAAWITEQRKAQPTPDGRGWTVEQLAEKIGVAPATIRGWEAPGGRPPSQENLDALERVFGVSSPESSPGGELGLDRLAAAIERQAGALEDHTAAVNRLLALVVAGQLPELEPLVSPGEGAPPPSPPRRELTARERASLDVARSLEAATEAVDTGTTPGQDPRAGATRRPGARTG